MSAVVSSVSGLSMLVLLLLCTDLVTGRLLLSSWSDLYSEDGGVDTERLAREADLLSVSTEPDQDCPHVELEVAEYEVVVEGKEELVHIKTRKARDTWDVTRTVVNEEEPWIQGKVVLRPFLNCFEQDDPFLIDSLKEHHIKEPSEQPYNFSVPEREVITIGHFGQPLYLDMVIFKGHVQGGFFIEAGASDFEEGSNSLHFELDRGWTGLLVEPNPTMYPLGFTRHRKAWASASCLATQPRPHVVQFSQSTMKGGMAGIVPEGKEDSYDMQCFPLYSLLMAAAGNVTVNYLSLDIEGAELQVLQTLPWDILDIEVMTVETQHAGKVFPGTIQGIRQFLEEKGYVHVYTVADLDDVFVRRDLYEGKYAPDLEKQAEFEIEMNGNQPWYGGVVDDPVKTEEVNIKDEL